MKIRSADQTHFACTQTTRKKRQLFVLLLCGLSAASTGCRTWNQRGGATKSLFVSSEERVAASKEPVPGEIRQVSEEQTISENARQSTVSIANYLTGKEPLNKQRAKELFRLGYESYEEARQLSGEPAVNKFAEAAEYFQGATEAAPGTAIEQDALFARGESLFFANYLPDARDAYELLQKNYPRSTYNDRAAARLFSITQYWIETEKVGNEGWLPFNFTDPTRPAVDTDGHAIRVLDQIRFDDPTGRLADDATMAAGIEHMRQGNFEEADTFFADLRDAYPDSEHLFMAHLSGIRCKLELYAGPNYSNLMLDEAEDLVQKTRNRFPDKMRDEQYNEIIARSAAEIAYHRAEHLYERAEYNRKKREFRAARRNYQQILDKYGNTPFAEPARTGLASTEGKRAVPKRPLGWLRAMFPDSQQKEPLITRGIPSEETILR